MCTACGPSDRIFFVTVNLRRRLVPFHTSKLAILLRVFDQSRRRLGFLLYGYVLRPDHWHPLIWTSYRLTISQVIHDVKKVSAQRVQTARGTAGALWQHQFWDRFVRHEKEFGDRMVYMHLNPVRKGLVAKPEQWRWSSLQQFCRRSEDGCKLSGSGRLRSFAGGISRMTGTMPTVRKALTVVPALTILT